MHGPSSYQLIEIKDGYQVIIKAATKKQQGEHVRPWTESRSSRLYNFKIW